MNLYIVTSDAALHTNKGDILLLVDTSATPWTFLNLTQQEMVYEIPSMPWYKEIGLKND